MSKRSYNQYCAIAHALDLVGERWTLLVVRELLTGPKRFTDLMNSLGSIGTNLLAARLKDLEANDVVERKVLPPPAASSVYGLTELGWELEHVITELWRWGRKTQNERRVEDRFTPGWSVLAMKYAFLPDKATGLKETYEYHIGAEVFYARINDGEIATAQGSAEYPDMVIETDPETFFDVVSLERSLVEAVDNGAVQLVKGDKNILKRACRVFGLPTS